MPGCRFADRYLHRYPLLHASMRGISRVSLMVFPKLPYCCLYFCHFCSSSDNSPRTAQFLASVMRTFWNVPISDGSLGNSTMINALSFSTSRPGRLLSPSTSTRRVPADKALVVFRCDLTLQESMLHAVTLFASVVWSSHFYAFVPCRLE